MVSSCVAYLNVSVGELGAGRLLGSASAGVEDGGGYCCFWFAVMVAVSAVATSPAGTILKSPAGGRFRPDVLSARRRLSSSFTLPVPVVRLCFEEKFERFFDIITV